MGRTAPGVIRETMFRLLAASLFEGYGEDNRDATFEPVEPESVTALVDERTRQLIAVVHEGGEVEYEKGVLPRVPFPGAP